MTLRRAEPETLGIVTDEHRPMAGIDVDRAEVTLLDTHGDRLSGVMGETSCEFLGACRQKWKEISTSLFPHVREVYPVSASTRLLKFSERDRE